MGNPPIYLDYNATTPVDQIVLDAMIPWFRDQFGNASSTHHLGLQAADAVRESRSRIAAALGVSPNTIVFTSGATEANNLVIRGVQGRVVVPSTEHKAVLETAESVEHSVVRVDLYGHLDLDELEQQAKGATLLSVMLANNETGVVHDLRAVVELARRHDCLVHTDATQAFGKLPIDLQELDVDFASISAHKVYGPKGIGALYVRRGLRLDSVMTGGGHERGVRSGTLNVPAIVGFGEAVRQLEPTQDGMRMRELLDSFLESIAEVQPFSLNSDHYSGLPNTLSIHFPGADAEAVIAQAPELCISAGSACTAAVPEPSHVLLAMGFDSRRAFESLRVSVGRPTTAVEVNASAQILVRAVNSVRSLASAEIKEVLVP